MNKWLRAVCVGAAAAAMLTASAFAANYTNCADSLHEMGLFQGTQNGYDLDRTPTRAEAAGHAGAAARQGRLRSRTLTYTARLPISRDGKSRMCSTCTITALPTA